MFKLAVRQKGIGSILLFFAALLLIFGAYYLSTGSNSSPTASPEPPNKTVCTVFSRSSLNIPPGDYTFPDRSEIRCPIDGESKVLFRVIDAEGKSASANSIYKFWKDGDFYYLLVVDQNGAGSGEGVGKLVRVEGEKYKTVECFYFVPENFSDNYLEPLSDSELSGIKNSRITLTKPECNNYSLLINPK